MNNGEHDERTRATNKAKTTRRQYMNVTASRHNGARNATLTRRESTASAEFVQVSTTQAPKHARNAWMRQRRRLMSTQFTLAGVIAAVTRAAIAHNLATERRRHDKKA